MNKATSLRDFDRVADRIRQHRQFDGRPIVIVEGPSDVNLLDRSFQGDWVYFPAGTRSIALEAAETLYNWNVHSFTCVVDRDFDDTVAEVEARGVPLFSYENADVEAMLSVGKAYDYLLDEIGSQGKIDKWGGVDAILRELLKSVLSVSTLRRANFERGWGIAFDDVDISSKVDSRTLQLKLQPYCAALSGTVDNNPSQNELLQYALGQKTLERSPVCPRGSHPYFRGKDLLAITGAALRSAIGTCPKPVTSTEHLSKVLRLSAAALLSESDWGRDLRSKLQ